mmetsp:Transcript_47932/g.113460  ORF Transcript_47932/g.113460 Transcript_47932/m.113460 type:complete len:261 (-) Transcript_47932:353-1135(-)
MIAAGQVAVPARTPRFRFPHFRLPNFEPSPSSRGCLEGLHGHAGEVQHLKRLISTVHEALVRNRQLPAQNRLAVAAHARGFLGHHPLHQLEDYLVRRVPVSHEVGDLLLRFLKGVAFARLDEVVDDLLGQHGGGVGDGLRRDCVAVQQERVLHQRDRLAQIAPRRAHQVVSDRLCQGVALARRNVRETVCHDILGQRLKSKLGAARSNRPDDSADVVADDAEPCDLRVRLHRATQRALCIGRHAVCLVENDELERRARMR